MKCNPYKQTDKKVISFHSTNEQSKIQYFLYISGDLKNVLKWNTDLRYLGCDLLIQP